MFHHLSARVVLMLGEGAQLPDAIDWVTRRLPDGLRQWYQAQIMWEMHDALR